MAFAQLQLNNLSVAKDVGKASGILACLSSDRISPSALLLVGSIEDIVVYLLIFDITGDHGLALSRAFCILLLILLASSSSVPSTETVTVDEELRESSKVVERTPPVIGEEHTVVSFLCGVGTGLAVHNNMGQMDLTLGMLTCQYLYLGLFGRIGSGSVWGFINNYQKVGTPRPLWNAASQILMVVGYALIAIAMIRSLCIVSILVGICYRVRLAFTVPTASELFGLKCYALIYNILILNLSLSSFLFSDLLAGFLNDTEATATASGGNTCIGPHCYRLVNSDGVCVCDWVYVGCVVDG
uniref:Nodulin-like domain-containing protein n=1 Tax=Lactuca sativa TaxID=4236 RepID=A0A9R1WXZ5_LACSA|nr:hypothetical protein LSAT_V11C800439500 [Lactuca sativa]